MATTRHSEETGIEYEKSTSGMWRHIDTNDGNRRQVGPQYKTKEELLSDHEDYLYRAGWKR